jgi:integrase
MLRELLVCLQIWSRPWKETWKTIMSIHRLKPSEIARMIHQPGKHADGGGLYLQVAQPGQASWVYRFTVAGKERWKSLGPASLYKLEEVREKAHELRKAKHSGTDPRTLINPGPAKAAGKSFGEWLSQYLAEASPHWRGGVTGQEATHYRQSFDKIPDFLKLSIVGIDEHAKNAALKVWDTFPVTRRKMGIRIDAIGKFAATGKIRSRSKSAPEVQHHEAMPAAYVPKFMADLSALDTVDARALQWTILSAARTEETLGATWKEITEVDGLPTWVIPGSRMKASKTHRVPLTLEMLALLGERRGPDDYLFRGHLKRENRLGAETLRKALRKFYPDDYTVHGFRSTFRDWAGELTDFDRTLAEWSLAHAVGSKLERDYARSDLLAKRRPLMAAWVQFAIGAR